MLSVKTFDVVDHAVLIAKPQLLSSLPSLAHFVSLWKKSHYQSTNTKSVLVNPPLRLSTVGLSTVLSMTLLYAQDCGF